MSCTQTVAWTHARQSETQRVLFGQCGWSGDVAGLVTSIRQRVIVEDKRDAQYVSQRGCEGSECASYIGRNFYMSIN